MFPDYLTSNYLHQLLKIFAMLDDFVVAGRQNCLFVFTRWNGGGTPMRQNTEFMYVSREHIKCALNTQEAPCQYWRYFKQIQTTQVFFRRQ